MGYHSIVYFASVVGIDRGYYEAAEIEGATHWQKIRHITLPLIRPTIITMVMLSVGKIFYSDFWNVLPGAHELRRCFCRQQMLLIPMCTGGLLQQGNIGMSAAAGLYQSVVGFAVVLIANGIVRQVDRENAFF